MRGVAVQTLVFFMRHLSQAFHTLLCLPSMPALCVRWSWWWAAATLEPARLEARWTGLTDLELDEDVLFRDRADLPSSAGGDGKL